MSGKPEIGDDSYTGIFGGEDTKQACARADRCAENGWRCEGCSAECAMCRVLYGTAGIMELPTMFMPRG